MHLHMWDCAGVCGEGGGRAGEGEEPIDSKKGFITRL